MTAMDWVAWASLIASGVPAALLLLNLFLYRSPAMAGSPASAVSVLIPARNEAGSIEAAVHSALASRGLELEVIVLDDHSTDDTAERVLALAADEPRLKLVRAQALPEGWCGKQFACHQLASLAQHPTLVFIDADVRLEPHGLAASVAQRERLDVSLLSGFPRQVTGTWLERLLIPLIHFVLLGFLPILRMRYSFSPAYAAGCGQLMITTRHAYELAGGHAAIRQSLHDGVQLPRAYRQARLRTDLFDATGVAHCRMYRSAADVWEGLSKNATEGLAHPRTIVPMSIILLLGQIVPPLLLITTMMIPGHENAMGLAALACAGIVVARCALCWRFRQSITGALLHPFAILALLVLQWQALLRQLFGRSPAWKGRRYPPPSEPQPVRVRTIDS